MGAAYRSHFISPSTNTLFAFALFRLGGFGRGNVANGRKRVLYHSGSCLDQTPKCVASWTPTGAIPERNR